MWYPLTGWLFMCMVMLANPAGQRRTLKEWAIWFTLWALAWPYFVWRGIREATKPDSQGGDKDPPATH